jgi:hypothetical protein
MTGFRHPCPVKIHETVGSGDRKRGDAEFSEDPIFLEVVGGVLAHPAFFILQVQKL